MSRSHSIPDPRSVDGLTAYPLLPQRVFVVHTAVHTAAPARWDGIGVAGAGAGSSVASRKFVQVNVDTELVEAVSDRSRLEVVLAG